MLAGHAELRTEMCTILAKLAVRPAPRPARPGAPRGPRHRAAQARLPAARARLNLV